MTGGIFGLLLSRPRIARAGIESSQGLRPSWTVTCAPSVIELGQSVSNEATVEQHQGAHTACPETSGEYACHECWEYVNAKQKTLHARRRQVALTARGSIYWAFSDFPSFDEAHHLFLNSLSFSTLLPLPPLCTGSPLETLPASPRRPQHQRYDLKPWSLALVLTETCLF